jgi:hypothetical protein
MGGDLWQWNKATINNSASRGLRGGDSFLEDNYLASSYRSYSSPAAEGWNTVGFRVAMAPEPSTIAMLLASVVGLLAYACRRSHG